MDTATWWALAQAGRRACGSFNPAGTWHTQQQVGGVEEDRGFLGTGSQPLSDLVAGQLQGALGQLGLAQLPSSKYPADTSRAGAHTYSADEKATSKFWRRFCGLSCP